MMRLPLIEGAASGLVEIYRLRLQRKISELVNRGGQSMEIDPGRLAQEVAYLADLADMRVALCGDALHSPGKVHEPYHLETDHYTGAGCRQAVESLRVLQNARPSALCPSHGPITLGDCWRAVGSIGRSSSWPLKLPLRMSRRPR